MGVDPDIGSSALRLWIAAGSAAILVTACVLAFARSKTTPLQSLERSSFIVTAAALGAAAAKVLLKRIRDPRLGRSEHALLPTQLVIRQSTAPVSNAQADVKSQAS